MALNRARVAQDIALDGNLDFQVLVEFFDSAIAATVLWTEMFTVPINATTAQLQAQVTARGQEIRAALVNQAAARAAVPNQTVVTIP